VLFVLVPFVAVLAAFDIGLFDLALDGVLIFVMLIFFHFHFHLILFIFVLFFVAIAVAVLVLGNCNLARNGILIVDVLGLFLIIFHLILLVCFLFFVVLIAAVLGPVGLALDGVRCYGLSNLFLRGNFLNLVFSCVFGFFGLIFGLIDLVFGLIDLVLGFGALDRSLGRGAFGFLLCVACRLIRYLGCLACKGIDLVLHNVLARVESGLLHFLGRLFVIDSLLSGIQCCQHNLAKHGLEALLLDDAARRLPNGRDSIIQDAQGSGDCCTLCAGGVRVCCGDKRLVTFRHE